MTLLRGATASRHAALALRAGIRPTRVSITVDGTAEQYWALAVEHAFSDDVSEAPVLTLPIVTRSMVAWRGRRPERVISITVAGDTSSFSWSRSSTTELPPERPYFIQPSIGILFERGGPPFFAVDGGARSTRQSIGAPCQLPARPAMMPTPAPEIPLKSCHRAVFFARFNMRVQEAPIGGAAAIRVRVVEMGAHDIAGIRLEWDPLCITC